MRRATRIPLVAAGVVYAIFAAACFRLAIEHGYERGVSVGEGSFVLVGAAGLFISATGSRSPAAKVAVATLPLVGWFIATPWNSGPPFLIVSLIASCIAGVALARTHLTREKPV